MTSSTQHSVQVTGLVNGAVALSGSVTDTGSGISLTGNTGSTIAFTGPLTVSTEGTTAFTATGGGTVTASNTTSTLAATNARALQVSGTAIGTQGLHFRSVSATNSVHGIEVTNAGAGHLVVSGDGSTNRNCTGGTISGMSSHGVALSSSGPATLRSLNVQGSGGAGIRAQSTAGLTVVAGALTDNTSDVNNPLTRNSIQLHEVTGTARLEATLVEDSVHNQIDVENSSGALTLEVIDTTVRDNGINSGLLLDAVGTSSVTLNVEGSTISDHHATAVHAFASDTADLTVNVADNTFSGNNVAVNVAAQDTATAASTVTGNTIGGHTSHNINITVHDDGVHNATVTDNVIDGSATIASVGIRLIAENDGVLRGVVTDNTVTGQTTGHGFRVIAREQAGQVHLVLADNHMVSTSASPAYSLEILEESTLCAAIVGNTGSSSHFSRDLFIDLFDSGASGQFEGLSPGPVTQAQLVAFLSAQNPPMRAGAFVASPPNAFGVAAGTCERP